MAEELWQTLMRFHREIVVPDIGRIVDEKLDLKLEPFKRDVNKHFDQLYKRLDTIESEIQSLRAAVKRLEADVAVLKTDVAALKRNSEEQSAARAEFRQELDQIKAQIAELQEKVSQIEAQLNPPTSAPA